MTATVTKPDHHRTISGINLLVAVAALVLATVALVRDGDDQPTSSVAQAPVPVVAGDAPAGPALPSEVRVESPTVQPTRAAMAFYGCDGVIGTNRC